VGAKEIVESLIELVSDVDERFEPSDTLKKMADGGEVFYP
jgi:hypothetical protein